jgi:hypothetical protein
MERMTLVDIARSWRLLFLEEEATRNYWRTYLLYGLQSHRDVLLDEFLPSLIYIKAVTILDDALEALISARGLAASSKCPGSLGARIDFLADRGMLSNASEVHRIRRRRNELAHESGARASWEELANDRAMMQQVLHALGLVGDPPVLEFYAERSPMRDSAKPGHPFERDFVYGVKANGRVGFEVKWTQYVGGE